MEIAWAGPSEPVFSAESAWLSAAGSQPCPSGWPQCQSRCKSYCKVPLGDLRHLQRLFELHSESSSGCGSLCLSPGPWGGSVGSSWRITVHTLSVLCVGGLPAHRCSWHICAESIQGRREALVGGQRGQRLGQLPCAGGHWGPSVKGSAGI